MSDDTQILRQILAELKKQSKQLKDLEVAVGSVEGALYETNRN